jgi:hypothetical protein
MTGRRLRVELDLVGKVAYRLFILASACVVFTPVEIPCRLLLFLPRREHFQSSLDETL